MGTQPVNAVRYRFIVPAHSVQTRVAYISASLRSRFVLPIDEKPRSQYQEPRPPVLFSRQATAAVPVPVRAAAVHFHPSHPLAPSRHDAPSFSPASRRTSSAGPASRSHASSSFAPDAAPPSSPDHPRRSPSPGSSDRHSNPAASASSPNAVAGPLLRDHPYPYPSEVPAVVQPVEEEQHPAGPQQHSQPTQHHTAIPPLYETSSSA